MGGLKQLDSGMLKDIRLKDFFMNHSEVDLLFFTRSQDGQI